MKNLLYIAFVFALFSCTTEVDLDLPSTEQQIVVEGYVESGLAPYVVLSRSIPYFTVVTEETLTDLIVTDADLVEVTNQDGIVDTLTVKYDLVNYPPVYYQADNPKFLGEENGRYSLRVLADGDTMTGSTYIPSAIALDSVWYNLELGDSLGTAYGHLSDPDSLGNYYRWYTKRLGKDGRFLCPLGGTFDDKFFNGESFDFFYYRSADPVAADDDESGPASYHFRTGDTIAVKYATIDYDSYRFWDAIENEQGNAGNPFSAPSTTVSNIEGGLGCFTGMGIKMDTIICEVP
jgi:hypothetical protein